MPRIYLHLAGTDLRQKIMEAYGGGEVERPKPQTLRCPRCSAPNHPGQNYCFTCGSPLEPAAKTVELEEMKKDVSEIKETLRTLLSGDLSLASRDSTLLRRLSRTDLGTSTVSLLVVAFSMKTWCAVEFKTARGGLS